jgi:hypothetical protein
MAEVSARIVDFFIKQLGTGDSLEKYRQQGDWASRDVIPAFTTALLAKGSRLQLKHAGQAFAQLVLEDLESRYDYQTVQEAIEYLPKVFTHYLHGDGAGIWKTSNITEGFVCLRENTPFDCFFTEGFLLGLLQLLGAAGAVVRQTDCREDNPQAKFCTYELKWMRANLARPSGPPTKRPR